MAPGAERIDPRRAAEAFARRFPGGIDPRVREFVPAFDAPFFQAGLAGYSDAAMRIVARRHGCPFCVTEALLDRTLLAGGRGFAKADLGEIEDNVPGGDEDQPLSGQIMGSDPAEMAAAAMKMVEQARRSEREYRRLAYRTANGQMANGPTANSDGRREHLRLPGGQQVGFWPPVDEDGVEESNGQGVEAGDAARKGGATPGHTFATIDVNLACPVKKIDKKSRGGHWLTDPAGAIEILEAVREAVPPEIACTVKLRRSYDDSPEMAAAFDRVLEGAHGAGYAWATVHARTVEQKYIGPSRWDLLRDIVRRHPGKVIFGSGDIWEAGDIFRMIEYAGVVGASVARGCIGNPWIFRQARALMAGEKPAAPTIAEQRAVLEEHFRLALAVNAHGSSAVTQLRRAEAHTGKTMRKFGIRFAAHHPRGDEVRKRFIAVSSLEGWRDVLRAFYEVEMAHSS